VLGALVAALGGTHEIDQTFEGVGLAVGIPRQQVQGGPIGRYSEVHPLEAHRARAIGLELEDLNAGSKRLRLLLARMTMHPAAPEFRAKRRLILDT